MNMPLAILNRRRRGFTAFSPSTLFALAEPGVWYDPSDLTTLFTDTAGTTPVTTPGNTVALMLDKSKGLTLGANIAPAASGWTGSASWSVNTSLSKATLTNSVDANDRLNLSLLFNLPTVGTVYEMLITVESISGGGIIFSGSRLGFLGASPTRNAAGTYRFLAGVSLAGAGSLTVTPQGTGVSCVISGVSVRELPGNHAVQATAASRPTYGVVPLGGRRNLLSQTDTMSTQSVTVTAAAHKLSFTGTGTVTLTGASTAGPLVGTGVSNRVSLTFTPTAASLTLTVSGSVTLAQLELGSAVTNYQRVGVLDVPSGLSFDVTESGVQSLSYLYFNGVNTFMLTGTITPGTDKVQVFAGVRKLSDASGCISELSADNNANTGSMALFTTAGGYQAASRGTSGPGASTVSVSAFAPTSSVLTVTHDISGDLTSIRLNGGTAVNSTADQGTGNFLAYPLYIGRRGGASLPLNGFIFGIITRFGPNLDAPIITNTETWLNGKTGAYT